MKDIQKTLATLEDLRQKYRKQIENLDKVEFILRSQNNLLLYTNGKPNLYPKGNKTKEGDLICLVGDPKRN